jgi:MoaA/NifB/PqqE/SkfB family radical SAM enzyme
VEPDRQIEIQLGHMCNNRCVFCVSGQRTARGEAGPMSAEPVLERIRRARAVGHRKITLLGGEPTLQPAFMRIVEETVRLGFEEIVLFTNGAKTARAEVVDAVRATGGRFTWRISIQGASRESHERTTRKPGSFDRIVRTLGHLRDRGERITVNMCVVQSNFRDVERFPALLAPYGVSQLHLDMMRPLDAGDRTERELRDTLPRYSELAEPLRRMVHGFEEGFDVNIGNLPYCVAPDLTPWIHHDGARTDTIAIDGDDELSEPWDKYLVKRRDKLKPASCGACVMRSRCSGVFETYARFYGTDELTPIDALALRAHDRGGRVFALWAEPDRKSVV